MAQICQFVDSIDSNPDVLFDCHDTAHGVTLLRQGTSIGAASLNQAYTSTLMVDGGVVGSSAYGLRSLNLMLQLRGSVDDAFTAVARLNRELDKATNLLKWQPDGAAQPVFFETLRSGPANVDLSLSVNSTWNVAVTVQAKPLALGLRQTVTIGTVSNNPASGCYFDVPNVLGDASVPALLLFQFSGTGTDYYMLAARHRGTASNLTHFIQAETGAPGLDTTNPGGGPDAAMSGTGTNNYLRTSFTSVPTAMNSRVGWIPIPTAATLASKRAGIGEYRVMGFVRRSDATSVMTAQMKVGHTTGSVVTIPQTTLRQVIDFGVFALDAPNPGGRTAGGTAVDISAIASAARASGTGTLDWDGFFLLPADESLLAFSAAAGTVNGMLVDGVTETVSAAVVPSAIFGGDAQFLDNVAASVVSGGFPRLCPGQSNRFYLIQGIGAALPKSAVADSAAVTVYYWPGYLNVRPPTL